MGLKLATIVVTACLCGNMLAQAPVPNLSRTQRDLLQAIVAAVDAAANQPPTADLSWQHHVLRASDGSHYVAFSVVPGASTPLPAGPVLLYVRLATARRDSSAGSERSAIREWLAGERVDPRMLPGRGIAVGEMPAFGAGAIGVRGSTPTAGSMDLKLMALERERARQEQEERNKKRRAELEGREAGTRELLPFEDFDVSSRSVRGDGTRIINRAFTAGPGDYDVFVAWAEPAPPRTAATVRVVRKALNLPTAQTVGLTTSTVILADSVAGRAAPYPPAEQASHPYSIGLMEITPAPTARYTRDGHLSVAFQVINASSSDAGMPDIAVGFRIVRVTGGRESPVASLNPQYYNASTLPPDFNVKLGHPLFAAVTAPLATLSRGNYRLKIVVNDRLARASADTEAEFGVIGTAASLLAEAPPLGRPFRREDVLAPAVLASIVDSLSPASPSPALARATSIARAGKLVDLLVEEPVPPAEAGIRTALTGLAFFSIGDASAVQQFQRALQQNAPIAPTQFLIGAARAMQSRDPDAIVAWLAALDAGGAPPLTPHLLAEAYLRRNDPERAAATIASAAATSGTARLLAATLIANRREAEAIALLDRHLAEQAADLDARWLMLHALYAQFARGSAALPPAELARFANHARTYIEAKGVNSALAEEWLAAISSV